MRQTWPRLNSCYPPQHCTSAPNSTGSPAMRGWGLAESALFFFKYTQLSPLLRGARGWAGYSTATEVWRLAWICEQFLDIWTLDMGGGVNSKDLY